MVTMIFVGEKVRYKKIFNFFEQNKIDYGLLQ